MGSIFGIIDKTKESIDKEILKRPMETLAYWKPDDTGTWVHQNVAFGKHLHQIAPRSGKEPTPFFDVSHGCFITADCRIDYREDLANELGIDLEVLNSASDSQLILRSYLKWGLACLDHLLGDFVFAIWDDNKQELFCARDHMGCRPLYYYESDRYFIFSSNTEAILCIPELEIEFDEDILPWLFSSTILPRDRTPYKGIMRLPASSCLIKRGDKNIELDNYWKPEVDPKIAKYDEEELVSTFLSLFEDAIYQRIRRYSSIGIELSGGLDSSSIAAGLMKVKTDTQKVCAFIHSLSDAQRLVFHPYKDESELSKTVSEYTGIQNQHYITGERGEGAMIAIQKYMDQTGLPVIQLFSVMSDLLLQDASTVQSKLILSGFGGDECVTHQARSIIDEYAFRGEWRLIWSYFSNRGKSFKTKYWLFLKALFKFWIYGFLKVLGITRRKKISRYRIKDLAFSLEAYKMFRAQILKLHKKNVNMEFLVRNQQLNLLRNEHVADRLENSYHMALSKGMEYAYPLLDIKLINFVYSVPVEFKNRNGEGRYLMRKAMEGLLPDEVRLRKNKFGAAMPNISFRLYKDKELLKKLIEEERSQIQHHHLDYEKLLNQLDQLSQRKKGQKLSFGPRIFFSSISLLILQKWQREGKINIGIKC